MSLTKRTPCVGICSTTYGDLVCRGCKRFAHEIVQWNGYEQSQQAQIWGRLNALRDEVVQFCLHIEDAAKYEQVVATRRHLRALEGPELLYEVVRHLGMTSQQLPSAGLVFFDGQVDALAALQHIDAEIYARSKAHYERNFKVPV